MMVAIPHLSTSSPRSSPSWWSWWWPGWRRRRQSTERWMVPASPSPQAATMTAIARSRHHLRLCQGSLLEKNTFSFYSDLNLKYWHKMPRIPKFSAKLGANYRRVQVPSLTSDLLLHFIPSLISPFREARLGRSQSIECCAFPPLSFSPLFFLFHQSWP